MARPLRLNRPLARPFARLGLFFRTGPFFRAGLLFRIGKPARIRLPILLVLPVLIALAGLTACAPPAQPRLKVFAMQGPPLALVGGPLIAATAEQEAAPGLHGSLERGGMVGNGEIILIYPPEGLRCRGQLKDGPAANGRVRGLVPCYPDEAQNQDEQQPARPRLLLLLTLDQHGPDQGVGLARFAVLSGPANSSPAVEDLEIAPGPPLLFFYHPWNEEAGRRFEEVRQDILQNMAAKKP